MNIPIAMLHHVADNPHASLKKWSISHRKFVELLDCIENKGLKTITFNEIVEKKLANTDLENKIILTFDDCPASLFDFAIPELVKRNMKGVFFMPTAYIGASNTWDIEEHGTKEVKLMSTDDLKQLNAMGMEIGSHGQKHIRLNNVDHSKAFDDISNSKATLEKVLERPVYSFAYPYGKIPKGYKKMLSTAGYSFGISIYSSIENNFLLRRFGIHETDDSNTINLKISKRYSLMRIFYDPFFLLKNYIFKTRLAVV